MRGITAPVACAIGLIPALLVGCGSVQSGTGVPIDSAPRELAQAICPKAYTCCMASQLTSNSNAGTDEASCETKTQQAYQDQLSTVQASQNAGRSTYDGDKLDACVKTIRSAECAALNMTNHLTGVPNCDSFVRPLVAAGGDCGFDWECIDSWCSKAPMTSGDGVCQPFVTAGAACGDQAKCGANLTCDATTATCAAAAPVTPPANACFYASGCNIAGTTNGTAPFALAALIALARRRRRPAR